MKNNLTFMPCFSLEPNKLVLYNRVFKHSDYNADGTKKAKLKWNNQGGMSEDSDSRTIKRDHHNMKLSENAYRTLRKKINWLYYLAKSRHRKTYNGKEIYNFKMCFLTLTLSSKQQHSTAEITNTLFQQLLNELRQRVDMQNYVWRLEYQKNGNVHYHLCSDTYIDYFLVMPIWNRLQKLHGYIDAYQAEHQAMSLLDYNHKYNHAGTTEFTVMAKRYAKGKQNNWTQPNSVDVKSVISKKAIAQYISKYFSKSPNTVHTLNEFDTVENTKNIRLWFCSRSLSKVVSVSDFCEAFKYDVRAIVECATKFSRYCGKYATMLYFEMTNLPEYCRKVIDPLLRQNAYDVGYRPAT